VSYPLTIPHPGAEASISTWSAFGGSIYRVGTYAHSGSVSAKLISNGITSSPSLGGAPASGPAVVPGVEYTGSAWAYCPAGYGAVAAILVFVDDSGTQVGVFQGDAVSAPAGEWIQLTATGIAPVNATKAMPQVRMLGVPSVNPTVLNPNSDFETSNDGWQAAFAPHYWNGDPAYVRTGVGSLRCEPNSGRTSTVENSFAGTCPVVVGDTYTVTGWIYAPPGGGSPQCEIGFMWWDDTGTYRMRTGGTFTTIPEGVWTKLTTSATAQQPFAGVRLGKNAFPNTIYADDFEIRATETMYVDDLELRTSALLPYRLTGGALTTGTIYRLSGGVL
jgi:hypothetical protein